MSTRSNLFRTVCFLPFLCFGLTASLDFRIEPPTMLPLRLHERDSIYVNFGGAFENLDLKRLKPCLAIVVNPAPYQHISITASEDLRALPVQNLTFTFLYELKNHNASSVNISLAATGIGYANLKFKLILVDEDKSKLDAMKELHYVLKVYRPQRLVDKGYNGAILIIAVINATALGCLSQLRDLKRRILEKKRELLVTTAIQYLVMPLITYGLMRIVSVQNEITLGYLVVVCVPGGGLGYLIVSMTPNTDKQLNAIHNILQFVLPIGFMPLWVYSLAFTLKNGAGEVSSSVYLLVLWIIGLTIPYTLGVVFSRKSAVAAEAFLNWLVKPLLLLAFILFITLGLYINIYMFTVLDKKTLVTGAIIPLIGFSLSGATMLALKHGTQIGKTTAIETAISNSVVVMAAIRFTLPQPDADFASAAVLWLLFFTPVPFVLMFIVHRIKRKIMSYFEKKDFEESHERTLKQSFAAITQNAFQIGGIGQEQNVSKPLEQAPHLNNDHADQDTAMLLMESGSSGISADDGHGLINRMGDNKPTHDDINETNVATV